MKTSDSMKIMKGLPLKKYVSNMEKSSVLWSLFKSLNSITLSRNSMYVANVGKSSLIPMTYKDMVEFKLERNFLHVNNVKIFFCLYFISCDRIHHGENPFMCKHCGKALITSTPL